MRPVIEVKHQRHQFVLSAENYQMLKALAKKKNIPMTQALNELLESVATAWALPKVVVTNPPVIGRPSVKDAAGEEC